MSISHNELVFNAGPPTSQSCQANFHMDFTTLRQFKLNLIDIVEQSTIMMPALEKFFTLIWSRTFA